jgi:hypothetical protein
VVLVIPMNSTAAYMAPMALNISCWVSLAITHNKNCARFNSPEREPCVNIHINCYQENQSGSIPSTAEFPADGPKHQGNNNCVEESNSGVLRVPSVR